MSKTTMNFDRQPRGVAPRRLARVLLLGLVGVTTGVQAQFPAAVVRVDTVRTVPVSQTVPVIGRVVSRQAGPVASRINGPVEAFMVDVGDRLEQGETIAVLGTQTLRLARDLDASRLREAEARLKTEQAKLALAQQTLRRFERLQDTNSASRSQYEDARQNVAIAAGNIAEAEAAIRSARVALDLAETRLSDTEIKAPYAGVITQRLTETGAYVQIGEDLVRMVADRALEIEADVPFRRVGGLVPGVELRVALDDGSEHIATVRAMVPEENRLTRTRLVRLVPTFGPTLNSIAPGQTVTVNVPLGASRDVLSVHKDAVNKNGDQDLVFVVENDVATPRSVTLGEAVGNRFEVLSGLKEGELAVVRGNERLRPNDKVRIDETPS